MTRWQGYIALALLCFILAQLEPDRFDSYLWWIWASLGAMCWVLGLFHLARETYKENEGAFATFTEAFEDVEPDDFSREK